MFSIFAVLKIHTFNMSKIDNVIGLTRKLFEEPDTVEQLTPEQAAELAKHLNPLVKSDAPSDIYVNLAVTNWRERYIRRFTITALIGYVHRLAMEYEPTDELERAETQWERNKKTLSGEQLAAAEAEHKKRLEDITKMSRRIIEKFMRRHFEYNPDLHVRAAGRTGDATGESHDDIMKRCESIEAKLRAREEQMYLYLRGHLMNTYTSAKMSLETVTRSIKTIGAAIDVATENAALVDNLEDVRALLISQYNSLKATVKDMSEIVEPISKAETLAAFEKMPPSDVFYHFDRYVTNNYEVLREATEALYVERPDIEFSIQVLSAHKTPNDARDYLIRRQGELRSDTITVQSGPITLLGPFKQNRDRVDFYNKNTEVLRQMMDQLELDEKLGKDLMEKQIKKKKLQDIIKSGVDSPELNEYKKHMGILERYGGATSLTREEQIAYLEAKQKAKEIEDRYDEVIPDGAIKMDVFVPDETGFTKKTIYTQEEAPLHMMPDSEFKDKYQPRK